MIVSEEVTAVKKDLTWTPALIKMLRGKRTLAEFGRLIGVPKNTIWRWEAGYVAPDAAHAEALSELAERESFLADWQLVGSVEIVGDLEEGSKQVARAFKKSLTRTARQLAD